MKNFKACNRYAKSLIDLAVEKGVLETVYEDMNGISKTVSDSRELQLLLQSPIIKPDAKQNILKQVFQSKVSDLTNSFIAIITDKGREQLLGGIAEAFIQQYKSHNNLVQAEVISAAPLDAEANAQVQAILAKISTDTAEIIETIDPSILGGFILKVGDKMIDSSVASQLKELKREFTENQYIPGF